MKNYLMALTLWFALPILTSSAGTNNYNQDPKTPEPIFKISYADAELNFNEGAVQEVRIDYRLASMKAKSEGMSLISTAHAAVPAFKTQDFYAIYDHLNGASNLKDMKPYITDSYYTKLEAKVQLGASPHAVLAMIQAMRPERVAIIESKINDTHAELTLTGQSRLGSMRGHVLLTGTDGGWKVERERWFAGGKEKNDSFAASYDTLSGRAKKIHSGRGDMMSTVTPEYIVDGNFLQLTKINKTRRKQAVMFVFLMNGDKASEEQKGLKRLMPKQSLLHVDSMSTKDHQRNRLHVMWSGSKKVVKNQQMIENKYPVDVSVARYDDGFAEGEWNMVLPSRKPREVGVSLMWSF